MKPLLFALSVVLVFGGLSAQETVWRPLPGHKQMPIWPGAVPDPQPVAGPEVAKTTGKEFLVAGRPAVGVSNVTQPTITVYSPQGKNTGAAVVGNGISSCEIARALGLTQKTAWFMDHRIRLSMQDDFAGTKMGSGSGEIEADESFIGGKARNMHVSERKRRITWTGTKDKTAVMGILERGGKVRATVVPNRRKGTLQAEVRKHVEAGTALYTDALLSYEGLAGEYAHQVVDHAVQYVDGRVHTNGLENFWSLLKRGISGTYVSVEPFHLYRYLDEQAFRFNNRKLTDADRFNMALMGVVGKRITYQELIGKAS
jgi:transposase-like protein